MRRMSQLLFAAGGISILSLIIIRYIIGEWVPFCSVALVLAVIFFTTATFRERVIFGEFFSMKTTKHGLNMGGILALTFVLLIMVNVIAIKTNATWDFSLNQINSLSGQSIKLLKSLNAPLSIKFFYKKGVEGNDENRRQFRDLAKKYQDQSSFVTMDFIEVNERPDLAKDFGVDRGTGVAFLEYKGRRNRIDKLEEQELTNAIIKTTLDKDTVIGFTLGHGERDLNESKDPNGMNTLKLMLENNRFQVKGLRLMEIGAIPKDIEILVIAGPVADFYENELKSLTEFLKGGGKIFMALEPETAPHLQKWAAGFGIVFGNNYILNIVDSKLGKAVNEGATFGSDFSQVSKVTKEFPKSDTTIFRNPQAIALVKVPNGFASDELVRTSGEAVAFQDLSFKKQGPQGQFNLVVEVDGKLDPAGKEFRLIAAGDADFLGNQLIYKQLNRDLVMNSLSSLANLNQLLSVSPKEVQVTELVLTPTKLSVLLFGFLIPLPLLMLALSGTLYYRRKNA